ncbi:hypothetical protein BDFB_003500 [Asbolus verrucosus]|uniref:7tm 6 domain containing protein n=1 Tax=Asbolus verrucosus TaxID=1661398 RepID=A0A482V7N9_ASBVE|nr:hypothetical protein BDFB_003500 [Asbolus verrucosus]
MDYKETRLMTVHGGITLIEIYFIFFVFNIKEFVSYGPVFFTMLYVSISLSRLNLETAGVLEIITIPIYSKFMGDISGDITMWAFESAGSETYSKIKKDIKIVTICAVANFALAFVAGCFYVQYLPNESELFWAYKLFEDHFSSQSPALTIIYKLTIPLMGYVMVVHAIQSIYYTQHMKFQMNMLHKHVKHLTDYENDRISEEMYYDEEYQTEICRRLRYCIERHINLVK